MVSASCWRCSTSWWSRATRWWVIERNLEVIKTADWIIDSSPRRPRKGGEIVATGTPEAVVRAERSYTGLYLAPLLQPVAAAASAATPVKPSRSKVA